MQLSRYLLTFPHPETSDRIMVYSTRKTSLAQIPVALYRDLAAGSISDTAKEQLPRLGVLVADHTEEQREIWDMQAGINQVNPNIWASVILGMACNFRCQYCYEGRLKDGSAMTHETADATVKYLLSHIRPGKKKFFVSFYGGEPLLYIPMIQHMARQLKPEIEARGLEFRINLVTNGSLLTPAVVEALLPLGLTSAKVTVDGPMENHNRNRPFADGRGSFAPILANLTAVAGSLLLTLQGIYTPDTWQLFPGFLDQLMEQGLTPEKFAEVSFHPVMRVNDEYASPHAGCYLSTNEPWLREASLILREAILQRGYPLQQLRPSLCMVDVDDGFCVNWDGGLYKCTPLAGRKAFQVGDVWRGMEGVDEKYVLQHWRHEEKCQDCIYLPLCFGGCRFVTLMETGAMRGVECQKDYYDAALEEILKQDLRFNYLQNNQK